MRQRVGGLDHRRRRNARGGEFGDRLLARTRDGWILTQIVGAPIFARWCELVGRPELVDDPLYASDILRGDNGEELSAIMQRWCIERTSDDAIAELAAARVPAAPVLRAGEVLGQPQVAAMGLVEPVGYPGANGPVPVIRAPIRLSGHDKAPPVRAPQVGEHSDAILAGLGYGPEAIAALHAAKII